MMKALLLIAALGAVAATSMVAWYAAYPSRSWILKPAAPLEAAEAKVALRELRARVSMTCPIGCVVKNDGSNRFEVRLPAMRESQSTEGLLTIPGHFSMRFVEPVQSATGHPSDRVLLEGGAGESPYFLSTSDVILTNADVDLVYVSDASPRGYLMNATLGDNGSRALLEATSKRAGQLVALIMDGRVITAARVDGRIEKYVQWESFRGKRTAAQHLRELRLLAVLIPALPMTHELQVVRRP